MIEEDRYRECRELHRRWAAELREEGLASIAELYRVDVETVRQWERAKARAHPDYMLTRLIRRILSGANPAAAMRLDPKACAALDADPSLRAYVGALIDGGPDTIKEAADQLRAVQRRLFNDYTREIAPVIVRAALRQWRSWGQMIIDAEGV